MMRIFAAVLAALALMPSGALAAGEITIPTVEYDLGELEALYRELPPEARQLMGSGGIREIIAAYRQGAEGTLDLSALGRAVGQAVRSGLGSLGGVMAAALLCGVAEIVVGKGGKGVSEMLMFCMMGICVSGVTASVYGQFASAMETVRSAGAVTEAASPLLMTLMAACGAVNVSGTVQPGAILLCQAITGLYEEALMPLTLMMCAFSTAAAITGQKHLNAAAGLIKSLLKWGIGASVTFFLGSVSIRCLNAAGLDGAGVKTLKYAFDKSIPLVGGMISGTYQGLLSGAVVLKNAAGTAAALLLLAAVSIPGLNMLAMIAALRISSALCALVSDGRVSAMLSGAAESCTYMFAVAAAVTLMNLLIIAAALAASGVG